MASTTSPVPVRRGSVVGPLILLLLGVVFLISNLRPELSAWRLFARYYPYLLIFWGAARLLEYVLSRLAGRPIARALTGGEVFLAILVSLLGNLASSAERGDWRLGRLGHRGLEIFGESFDFPVEAARKVPPSARVVIQNPQGTVRVSGSDGDEVRVTGRKTIRALDRAGAEEADRSSPVEIVQEGNNVYVRTAQERQSGENRISAELTVTTPRGVSVKLEGRSGEWEVGDLGGSVEVNSATGGVRLTNIGGGAQINVRRSDVVYAHQVKGGIVISGRGRDIDILDVEGPVSVEGGFSGTIKFQNVAKAIKYSSSQTELSAERVPGRMEMELGRLQASDIVGPFRLTTSNKDVRLEDFSRDVEIQVRRGDVALQTAKAPLGNIQVETSSGDIELALPANAHFRLEASTQNGRAENEFGGNIQVDRRGNSAEMRGGGAGGALVRLSTKRGNVTLRKLEAAQRD